jgi:chromosomal replication initiator protein
VQVDSRHRFDNFVVGSANRLAVAAARAVAESPGRVYNPLFIYSSSGLGKTHLMGAIGNAVRERHEKTTVEYVTLDDFVGELHAAVAAGGREAFARRLEGVGLLLIDDVQFLTGQRETQTEILRLLNALQWGHNQIVMASDRAPTEIADVDERLVTRLSGGLVVDIATPDFETRVAILRGKAEERGASFLPGVIEELAQHPVGNVRELQGALNRLIAHQSLGSGMIEPHQVAALVGAPVERVPAPAPTAPLGSGDEFASFLSDVASAVAHHVESWRSRVGETVAYWSSEGYRTTALEQLLDELEAPPHWEAVLRGFVAVIERLRALEAQAVAIDPTLAGAAVFRDAERVLEAEQLVERVLAMAAPPPGPSAAFQRAGYEVGESNQLAVRAADAVVAEPGRRYNPLFVHGPSGVGKTHLLNAIGNELLDSSGGAARVAVVSAQDFMDELIAALQEGAVGRWRARYRGVDTLLIDDVQFVAGKERTQDELFHVFNALYAEGRQLVLVSDRAPRQLEGLEQRLRSRFEGGLVVEIQAPDPALRERLVARLLVDAGAEASADVVAYLAARQVTSVRELAGMINRVTAAASLQGAPVSLALARTALDDAPVLPPAEAGATPIRGVLVQLDPASMAPRAAAAAARRARAQAARAAVAPSDALFLDEEKTVLDWPDVSGRVIEELR